MRLLWILQCRLTLKDWIITKLISMTYPSTQHLCFSENRVRLKFVKHAGSDLWTQQSRTCSAVNRISARESKKNSVKSCASNLVQAVLLHLLPYFTTDNDHHHCEAVTPLLLTAPTTTSSALTTRVGEQLIVNSQVFTIPVVVRSELW